MRLTVSLVLFALLIGAVVFPTAVIAQNYYSYNQYQQYQQHNGYYERPYYPAQKIIAQEIAVAPLIVTVPVESKAVPVHAYGSPYYYSASDAYREKSYLRTILREELRGLISTGTVTPTTGRTVYSRSTTTARTTAATTPSTAADTLTPADLQAKIVLAYQGNGKCISCHGGGSTLSGNFRLVMDDGKGGYTLVKQNSDKRWKIYGRASVGDMPPAAAEDAHKAMESIHMPALLAYAVQKD